MLSRALVSLALLIALGLTGTADAPAPRIAWISQFGTVGPALDAGESVAADGFVYVGGAVAGVLTFPGQTPRGGRDAILRKYDAGGNEIWTRQFGTTGEDSIRGVALYDNAIYVAGFVGGLLTGQPYVGSLEVFVRKYDPTGNEVWTRQFGTFANDQACALAVDSSGVYVTGNLFVDAFVRKYDFDGNEVWTRRFGGSPSYNYGYGISVDATGVYVAGETYNALPGQVSSGAQDAFVRKYDVNGNELWTRQFGTPLADAANAVFVDGTGVHVAGATSGVLPGQTSKGGSDAFVRTYDADGNEQWTQQLGTSANDRAQGISGDASGIYAAGLTGAQDMGGIGFLYKFDLAGTPLWNTRLMGEANSVSADAAGPHVAGLTFDDLPGQNGYFHEVDAYLSTLDGDGALLWSRRLATYSRTADVAQAVDAKGSVYVAGYTTGSLSTHFTAVGLYRVPDAFLRKYDADGNELWTRQFAFGYEVYADYALAIAVDATGVYVGGSTRVGLAPGAEVLAFVRKYDPNGTEDWTREFGAGLTEVLGLAAIEGEVYVAGRTDGALTEQVGAGGTDAFLRKYDAAGLELWTRQFGTAASDEALAVTADLLGVYVGGTTSGALPGQESAGLADAFVRRYDHSGNEIWTRQFGTAAYDSIRSVSSSTAAVYVAGETDGILPGQTGGGDTSPEDTDAFVRRYDLAGGELWTHQFGSAGRDLAHGVLADFTGVYVAGETSGALPNQASAGGVDAFVRKYSFAGHVVWSEQFGTPGHERALGITGARFLPRAGTDFDPGTCSACRDAAGTYVVGTTTGNLTGQAPEDANAFVLKIVETTSKQ